MVIETLSLGVGDVSFSLTAYGAFQTLAFVTAVGIILARQQSRELLGPYIHELLLVALVGAAALARLLKPLVYAGTGMEDGTFFLGCALGGVLSLWGYCRLRGLPTGRVLDSLAPCVLAGSALGRVGCFFGGCCYGVRAGSGWGSILATDNGRIPTQLLQAGGDLLCLLILVFYISPRVSRIGGKLVWATWLYSALRFPFEYLRDEPHLILGLTQGQVFSVGASTVALAFYLSPNSPSDQTPPVCDEARSPGPAGAVDQKQESAP